MPGLFFHVSHTSRDSSLPFTSLCVQCVAGSSLTKLSDVFTVDSRYFPPPRQINRREISLPTLRSSLVITLPFNHILHYITCAVETVALSSLKIMVAMIRGISDGDVFRRPSTFVVLLRIIIGCCIPRLLARLAVAWIEQRSACGR
jgi:hypothetical protein